MNTITCVVDNKAVDGSGLKTEHGVAFWIDTEHGSALFDTGQSAQVLKHNFEKLDLRAEDIDAVAISHAHYDHTGGLEAVLVKNPELKFFANADIFRGKYLLNDGVYEAAGFEYAQDHYAKSAHLHLSSEPAQIFPNLWTTGEIVNREEPEGRSANHHIRKGGKFVPDPYKDDMSLVLKTEKGLVLICGCCHAGLLNTLASVEENFEGPIIAAIGGTHLMTADGELLRHVIDVLKGKYVGVRLYLNHCTGDDALKALTEVFGSAVRHFKAGDTVSF